MRRETIKRGDTAVFEISIEPPEDNYDWTGVTVSFVITADENPTNNDNALLYEKSKAITVNSDGTAVARFSLDATHSKRLIPRKNYHVEYQLEKDNEVLTLATALLAVEQDYVV